MFLVYVKHYLTSEGMQYFKEYWFPRVQTILSQQKGYVRVSHEKGDDVDDCVNVLVKFEDEPSLKKWVDHPEHDSLITALDKLRSRDYWEAAGVHHPMSHHELPWEKIKVMNR